MHLSKTNLHVQVEGKALRAGYPRPAMEECPDGMPWSDVHSSTLCVELPNCAVSPSHPENNHGCQAVPRSGPHRTEDKVEAEGMSLRLSEVWEVKMT